MRSLSDILDSGAGSAAAVVVAAATTAAAAAAAAGYAASLLVFALAGFILTGRLLTTGHAVVALRGFVSPVAAAPHCNADMRSLIERERLWGLIS